MPVHLQPAQPCACDAKGGQGVGFRLRGLGLRVQGGLVSGFNVCGLLLSILGFINGHIKVQNDKYLCPNRSRRSQKALTWVNS